MHLRPGDHSNHGDSTGLLYRISSLIFVIEGSELCPDGAIIGRICTGVDPADPVDARIDIGIDRVLHGLFISPVFGIHDDGKAGTEVCPGLRETFEVECAQTLIFFCKVIEIIHSSGQDLLGFPFSSKISLSAVESFHSREALEPTMRICWEVISPALTADVHMRPTAEKLYFYITQIGHYYCTHAYSIRRDYFSPFLILCVRAGCLRVDYRGGSYRLLAGDAMLVDCREPHYYYSDMDGLEFYYLHFEGSNAHEICQHILAHQGPLVEKQRAAALGEFLKKTLQFYDEGKTETEFDESLRVYEIFRYLHSGTGTDAAAASYIDVITGYINDHIDQRITLEELADAVSLSSFHFSRRFKRDTGYSPVEYANRKKLDYAKTLLIRTEWSITEIAEKTGFSFKGFIKLFTNAEGCSPRTWRNQHRVRTADPDGPVLPSQSQGVDTTHH